MNLIYNKGIPKFILAKLSTYVDEAVNFLNERYPHINFDHANIRFSYKRKSANFIPPRSNETIEDHKINIRIGIVLHLYKKSRVGLTTPPSGFLIGHEVTTICTIIHELTHLVQYIEKRSYSEVETTYNEIEYLKLNHPFWFKKLITC